MGRRIREIGGRLGGLEVRGRLGVKEKGEVSSMEYCW